MQSTSNLPAPVIKSYGALSLTASRTVDGGYAINTMTASGGTRFDALGYTTRDRDAFKARYRLIAEGALAGKTAEQIADEIHAGGQQAVQDAEQILTDALGSLAAAGTHRQVRPTMAGAQLADVSDPQAGILHLAHQMGGTVRRSREATVAQLRALARKGLVTLNYEAGRGLRKVIESATLTVRGQQRAQVA